MPAPPRRTQAQRRADTRAKLLAAAIDCLVERGYAGTSLADVAARAGLTNGALWRHFPTKAELMAEASLECQERLDLTPRVSPSWTPERRIRMTVNHLWTQAAEPEFQVLVELLLAGRTDATLRAALESRDRAAGAMFYEAIAAGLGPELAEAPDFRRNSTMLALALYGTVLTSQLRTQLAQRRLREEAQALAVDLFLPDAGRRSRRASQVEQA